MNENDAHLCLDYNRTKQDSKNYKNEWEIRETDITHTEKAAYIMQKILKLFCRKQKSKEKN